MSRNETSREEFSRRDKEKIENLEELYKILKKENDLKIPKIEEEENFYGRNKEFEIIINNINNI